MTAHKGGAGGPDEAWLARIPDNLFLEPVDYLFADHCRQAELCQMLKTFVLSNPPMMLTPEFARAMLRFLNEDLVLHIQDEEEDFLPRLKVRADPADHFADVLTLMDREHQRDSLLAADVRDGMAVLASGEMPEDPDTFRNTVIMMTEMHLSHLNWENAILLPLARKWLKATDLEAIGRSMAKRRSIPFPGD